MNIGENQYLELLEECLTVGSYREGRNGGTYGLFGRQMRFDLSQGFPLLTTKKLFWKAIVVELLWFLRGDTNIKYLQENGVHIWDEWANADGDLGPVYGSQWRRWRSFQRSLTLDGKQNSATGKIVKIDQIANVIEGLKTDPYGRRHIVTAWNPAEIPDMALPPCHCLFQFFVSNGKLSCQLYQRSADIFLGVPFNIASYALLTHMIAKEVGLEVGDFVHTFGDVHLYANHVEQAKEQLSRAPREAPVLVIPGNGHSVEVWPGIFNLTYDEIKVDWYDPHPAIKAEVSV